MVNRWSLNHTMSCIHRTHTYDAHFITNTSVIIYIIHACAAEAAVNDLMTQPVLGALGGPPHPSLSGALPNA
jgi:hypothetical protein